MPPFQFCTGTLPTHRGRPPAVLQLGRQEALLQDGVPAPAQHLPAQRNESRARSPGNPEGERFVRTPRCLFQPWHAGVLTRCLEREFQNKSAPKSVSRGVSQTHQKHVVPFQTDLFQMPVEEIVVLFQEPCKTLSKECWNQWLCRKMQFHPHRSQREILKAISRLHESSALALGQLGLKALCCGTLCAVQGAEHPPWPPPSDASGIFSTCNNQMSPDTVRHPSGTWGEPGPQCLPYGTHAPFYIPVSCHGKVQASH